MYSLQAKKAAKRLGEAELEVGRVNLVVRRCHLAVRPTATQALRKYGRDIGKCRVFLSSYLCAKYCFRSGYCLPPRVCACCPCRLGVNSVFAHTSVYNMQSFAGTLNPFPDVHPFCR